MNSTDQFINDKLNGRLEEGLYRSLKKENDLVDFCSNDYLGFARSAEMQNDISAILANYPFYPNGSTGSRLLKGNTAFCEELETDIAAYHQAEAGLIFNSGYDANVGLFSSLPQRGDTIITDELIHASMIDGCRLSHATRYKFKHNDLNSLEEKLKHAKGNCYIGIESVYSMDGDTAPLNEIADLADSYNARLIVDEAHAVGVFDKGLVNRYRLQNQVYARIVTFGKALGTHGAVILGNKLLRNYLINFARPFIYTTALPYHQLAAIKVAYGQLFKTEIKITALHQNINSFRSALQPNSSLINSDSAIQCLIMPGNANALKAASYIQQQGFDVRPILSPTVKFGQERLRVCLHSFNTLQEVNKLTKLINEYQADE